MTKYRSWVMALTFAMFVLSLPACSSQVVGEYESYRIHDIELIYPSNWEDKTEELGETIFEEDPNWEEYASVVAWGTPSDSVVMMVIAFDREAIELPQVLTEEDKQFLSTSFVAGFMTETEQPTLLSQEVTEVAGEWAWEVNFTGKGEGLIGGDARGSILVFFTKRSACVLMFLADEREWDNVEDAYLEIKNSISTY